MFSVPTLGKNKNFLLQQCIGSNPIHLSSEADVITDSGQTVQVLKESCSEKTNLLRDSRVKRTRGSSPNVTIKRTALTRPVETFLQESVDAQQAPARRSASCRRPLGEAPQADRLAAAGGRRVPSAARRCRPGPGARDRRGRPPRRGRASASGRRGEERGGMSWALGGWR